MTDPEGFALPGNREVYSPLAAVRLTDRAVMVDTAPVRFGYEILRHRSLPEDGRRALWLFSQGLQGVRDFGGWEIAVVAVQVESNRATFEMMARSGSLSALAASHAPDALKEKPMRIWDLFDGIDKQIQEEQWRRREIMRSARRDSHYSEGSA